MRGAIAKRLRRAAKEKWEKIPMTGMRAKDGVQILYDAGKRIYKKAKRTGGGSHAM